MPPLGVIPCHVSSLLQAMLHVVQGVEACRGLKHPQSAASTGLWTFSSEQRTFSLQIHPEKSHADCDRGPGPSRPKATWEHTAWHAIESPLGALHRRDFLFHSSSASMSTHCDITSSVWTSELTHPPTSLSFFFRHFYRWNDVPLAVLKEMKPKVQTTRLTR